jgi:hypothetical protein
MTPTPDTRRRYERLPFIPKPNERILEVRRITSQDRVEVILAVEAVELIDNPEAGRIDCTT